MFALLTLLGFWFGWQGNDANIAQGQTMAFAVLALCQIVQAFNMRSEHSLFKIGPFKNKTLNLAAMVSTALVALVLFTPIGKAFGLVILPAKLYFIALGLIFVPLVVMEIFKLIGALKNKNK